MNTVKMPALIRREILVSTSVSPVSTEYLIMWLPTLFPWDRESPTGQPAHQERGPRSGQPRISGTGLCHAAACNSRNDRKQ